MRLDFGIFVLAAIGIHLAVVFMPSKDGSESSGGGGEALVALIGSSAQAAVMVQEWDRPPDVTEIDPPDDVPEPPDTRPVTPEPEAQANVTKAPELPVPDAPASDQIDVQSIPTLSSPNLQSAVPTTVSEDTTPTRPELNIMQRPPTPETTFQPPETHVQGMQVPVSRPPSIEEEHPIATRDQVATQALQSQQAVGAGTTTEAGTGVANTAVSEGEIARLEQIWGSQVRRAIERQKRYPRKAKSRGERGAASVTVSVDLSGRLLGFNLTGSTGSQLLDTAALEAVRRAGQFPSAPAGVRGNQHTFHFRIVFE